MALEGTLNYLDISHLLKAVEASRKSGVLRIWHRTREAFLFFQEGRLIRAESNRFHEGLGALLVEADLLNPEDLDRALQIQSGAGEERRLGAILCDDFDISSSAVERILGRQFERIVFDVFSWDEGSFTFHFHEPNESLDRFHLNPVDFILNVGITAGILAEEGLEKELKAHQSNELVFLLGDPFVADKCREYYRRKDLEIIRFSSVAAALTFLRGESYGVRLPIVVADMICPRSDGEGLLGGLEILDEIKSINTLIPVILLGDSDDSQARIVARKHGALVYVKKPSLDFFDKHEEEAGFEVFFLGLENAVQKATAKLKSESGALTS